MGVSRNNPSITIGIRSDVEAFMADLSKKLNSLGNTGIDLGLSDSFKTEVNEIEKMVRELQKTLRTIMSTKLNSATFNKYQQEVGQQISAIDQRTTALEKDMSALMNTMNNADSGKMSNALDETKRSMVELGEATLSTLDAVKQIQDVARSSIDISLIDASKEKRELEELQSLLEELMKTLDAQPKTGLFNSQTDAVARLEALYKEFNILSEQAQEFEFKDVLSNDDLKTLTLIRTKLAEIANEFVTITYKSEDAFGDGFANIKIDSLSIDGIRAEFEDVLGDIEHQTTLTVERINNELSKIDISVSNASISDKSILSDEEHGLSVPLNVRTTSKGLLTQCLNLLHSVQDKLEDKPLEISLELTTAWGTKKNKEILKQFQNKINQLSDQTDISEFQDLYDKVAKSFGNEIDLKVGTNIEVVEKQIIKSIEKLKQLLKNEPLNIDLAFEVDDSKRAKLQKMLTDITSNVVVTIKNIKFDKELNVKDSIKQDLDSIPIEQFDRLVEKIDELKNESGPIIESIIEVKNILSSLPTDKLISDVGELIRLLEVGFNALSRSELDQMFASLQDRVNNISGSLRGKNLDEIKEILRDFKEYQSFGGDKSIFDLSDQKNIQTWFKKHYEDQNILQAELAETAQDVSHVNQVLAEQDVSNLIQPLTEVIELINRQAEAFKETENTVSSSVTNEIADLSRLSSFLESLVGQIQSISNTKGVFNAGWIKDLKKIKPDDLNGAADALKEMHSVLQNLNISDNNFIVKIQTILDKGQELASLAKILSSSSKQITEAEKLVNPVASEKDSSNLLKAQNQLNDKIAKLITKGQKYTGDEFDNKYTQQFRIDIENSVSALEELQKKLQQPIDAKGLEEAKKEAKQLADELDKNIAKKALPAMKKATEESINKAIFKLDQFVDANSAMGKQWRSQFENLRIKIQTADSVEELKQLQGQVIALESQVIRAGKSGVGSFERLANRIKQMSTNFVAMHLSLYDIWRYAKQAIDTIVSLDTALVDLKKTTTMTNTQLEEFYYNSSDIAKQTGATTQEIISQAAAWSRLGYSSKEAATEMAALSSQFAAISPGMSLDNATDDLVSTMKAFHIEVDDTERDIMDNVNRIGNTFATSNQEIGEMLKRSSAAMNAANNSLEETIALESAAVQITRNAETTGTAFRTISMRIRGKQSLPPYTVMYMLCA